MNDKDNCEHQDIDDFYCLDCGKDLTEEILSKGYDQAKDRLKEGDWMRLQKVLIYTHDPMLYLIKT